MPAQWNYLDFTVVAVGYLGLLPGIGNISAIRVVRILRALRTLTLLPGLRIIVRAMIHCIRQLFAVLMLMLFLTTIYSVVGVHVSATVMGRPLCQGCWHVDSSR